MASSFSIRRRLVGSQTPIAVFFLLLALLMAGAYYLGNWRLAPKVQQGTQAASQLLDAVQHIQNTTLQEKAFFAHLDNPEQRSKDARAWLTAADKVRAVLQRIAIAKGDQQVLAPEEMAELVITMSAADTYAEAVQAVLTKAGVQPAAPEAGAGAAPPPGAVPPDMAPPPGMAPPAGLPPEVMGPPTPPEAASAAMAAAPGQAVAAPPAPDAAPSAPAQPVLPPNLAELNDALRAAKVQLAELTVALSNMSKTKVQQAQVIADETWPLLEIGLAAGLGLAVVGLGLSLWVMFSVPRRVVREIAPLTQLAQDVSRGHTDVPLEQAHVKELEELSQALEQVRKIQRAVMLRQRAGFFATEEENPPI